VTLETTVAEPRRDLSRRWLALLGVPGAALSTVGVIDVIAAEGIGAKLFGVAIAAVAGAVLVAAIGAYTAQPWWRAVAVVANVLMGILAVNHLVLFASEFIGFSFLDVRLIVFGAFLSVVTALVAWALLRASRRITTSGGNGGPPSVAASRPRSEVFRDFVGASAIAGFVVTGLSFWYTTVYQPATRPPFLNVDVSQVSASAADNRGAVPVTLRLDVTNAGDVRARVMAGWYNVLGIATPDAQGADRYLRDLVALFPGRRSDDFAEPSADGTALRAGVFPQEGSWLEPHEQLSEEVLVFVPRGAAAIHVDFTVIFARGERVAPIPTHTADVSGLPLSGVPGSSPIGVTEWGVRPQSLLDLLRRDPLRIVLQWRRDDAGTIFISPDVKQGTGIWLPPGLSSDPNAWKSEDRTRYLTEREKFLSRLAELGIFVGTQTRAEFPLPGAADRSR
jgi:hypothetical protein